MARHEVGKEIMELAALLGKTEEEIAAKYAHKLVNFGSWEACNTRTVSAIRNALADAREAKRKSDGQKALAQKLEKGAVVWRKVGAEWLVQVTGQEVKAGDMVTVERKSGEKSQQLVKYIVSRGSYGIYCKV